MLEKITELGLEKHTGQIIIFQRDDITLEGRLYLTDGNGNLELKKNRKAV